MLSKDNFEEKKTYFKLNTLKEVKNDLFASSMNKKLPIYVSYKPSLDTIAVDAFSLSWSTYES